ncbi:MAG: hypothetical protein ACLSHO_05135 [Dysosmobacter sp.]
MKSRASLFLTVLLLALSLTACGKEPAKNDRNDAGSGQNSAYDAVSTQTGTMLPTMTPSLGGMTTPSPPRTPIPPPTPPMILPETFPARLWTGCSATAVSMTGTATC